MNRTTSRYRSIAALCAAVAGCTISQPVFAQAKPSIVFDLRVNGTGGKTATVASIGESVKLDLYVNLQGFDGNPLNDRIQSGTGSFISSSGGLLGDLQGLTPPATFAAQGSNPGLQEDLDGDGDLDVGGTNQGTATGYYGFRSGSMPASQPAKGFFVGQVLFTPTAVKNAETSINWIQRINTLAIVAIFDNLLGYPDLTKIDIQSAAPVVIRGTPPQGTTAVAISGLFDTHLSLGASNRFVPTGASFSVTRGLSISAGGILAASSGSVRINDAISANNGGTLQLGSFAIANTDAATFTQNSGSTITGITTIGGAGKAATLRMTGGSLNAGATSVGPGAASLLDQQGGAAVFNSLRVANGATAQFSGGTTSAINFSTIESGATLTVAGGDVGFTNDLVLGNVAGVPANLSIQGGSLSIGGLTSESLNDDGQVNIIQSGGTFSTNLKLFSPKFSSTPSTYVLNNGTFNAGAFYIGGGGFIPETSGSGVMTQNGGNVEAGNAYFSALNGKVARYELNGGSFKATSLTVGAVSFLNQNQVTAVANVVQSGGAMSLANLRLERNSTHTATGGSIEIIKSAKIRGTLDLTNSPVTMKFSANSFTSFVDGTLLNATNATFNGGAGSLLDFPAGFDPFTAIGTLNTQGLVHVAGQPLAIPPNQSLSGSGSIQGDVTNSGKVSPGNSPGVIDVDGTYTQNDNGSLFAEIAGRGTESFDQLNISGSASIDGLLTVSLLDGFTPSTGDTFKIFSAASIAGQFDNVITDITIPGGRFDIVYSPTSITLTNFQVVPEPAAISAIGVIGIAALRRRRKN